MATVVQFGAGAIGRGFLGQVWSSGGREIVFVDVDADLCRRLSEAGEYGLSLVTNRTEEQRTIRPVRALPTSDREAVLAALAECEFAAVSIGPHVTETVERFFVPLALNHSVLRSSPLNVIVAENDPHAAETLTRLLREGIEAAGGSAESRDRVVFIQAIIGRMVPRPEPGAIDVVAEPYLYLPLEAGRWQGDFPAIPCMVQQTDFRKQVEQKLYVHNAGHAALAYLGYRRGHESIHECAADPDVVAGLRGFWSEVNVVLAEDGLPEDHLIAFEEELIERFGNRVLGDTVTRVARDPIRKLHREDRLVYPALAYVRITGQPPSQITKAIAAALSFDDPDDPAAVKLQERIRSVGVRTAFSEAAHFEEPDPEGLVSLVEEAYNALSFHPPEAEGR
ncbi:MAG: hypothetical protein SFU56_07235 [Capsulimonadales bacterium]|nr:hypothetical protein [Capsulimonadales bacterium]